MRHLCAAFLFLAACASEPAPLQETGEFEAAPGVTLAYERVGAGPQIVIVPGRLFLAESFRELASPDRTLIFYDMRNRGASGRVEEGAALTVMEDVRDLEAVRAHFGAERFTPIGFSYLGVMVALYAAEHPDRVDRIVQIGPAPRDFDTEYAAGESAGDETLSPEAFAARDAARERRAGGDLTQEALCRSEDSFSRYVLVGDPANLGRLSDTCQYENEWPENLMRHFSFHFADIQQRDFPAEMFNTLTQPVLVIHGTLDRNAPYGAGREWARTFPDAQLVTVTGAAHAIWADDPGIVDDVDTFLRGDWPARAERLG